MGLYSLPMPDTQKDRQDYTTAVLEGRWATAEWLRAALDCGGSIDQHDCGTSRSRAVFGEIGGNIIYCSVVRR